MKVLDVIEKEDGSAVMKVDLTTEETAILLEYALQNILIKTATEEIEKNVGNKP